MTALVVLSATNVIDAHADYTIPIDDTYTEYYGAFRYTLVYPSGSPDIIISPNTIIDSNKKPTQINRCKISTDNYSTYSYQYDFSDSIVHCSGDLKEGSTYYLVFGLGYSQTGFSRCTADSVRLSWLYSGDPPDNNNYATEQRYYSVNWYSGQFTKSNSLPLIYSVEHTLDEFTPEGQCNSIQVDASTVGGDKLEWRLNLGQSGIDGQTAWLPIGFKMPVETGSFDLHSVQLRMQDPTDPTQYYPLDPSELSLCVVTYGYTSDVVMQLPHSDYQELPTGSGFEEIQTPTAPNFDDLVDDPLTVFDYLGIPLQMITRIFAPAMTHPDLFYLAVVAVFCCCVFAIVW